MNKEKFMLYYSFVINTLVLFVLVFGGIIFADTNGVWHRAEDVQGGVFGGDEQDVSASLGYKFLNPLRVDSDFTISSIVSCNGKLITDGTGKVLCGIDNVNDADFDPNNEKPIAGTGISVSDRTVSVDTAVIQNRVSGSCTVGSYVRTIAADGTVVCGVDNINDADADPNNEKPLSGTGISVSDRTVSVDTNIIATKTYVDSKVASSSGSQKFFYPLAGQTICTSASPYDYGCARVDASGNLYTLSQGYYTSSGWVLGAVAYNPYPVPHCARATPTGVYFSYDSYLTNCDPTLATDPSTIYAAYWTY